MRLLVAMLGALIACARGLSADTYPRQPAVDAIHYQFAVSLSASTPQIEGETAATFRLAAPTAAIELDLISAAAGKGMTVQRVMLKGAPIEFVHANNRLRLTVPNGARPGDDLTYTITYRGTPADALLPLENLHGEPVRFSEGWPNKARHWLPMIDHPYFALLYREQFEGRDAFEDGLRRSRTEVLEAAAKMPDTPVVHRNLDDLKTVLNQFVYEKGGWVLHMLRVEIGDDRFWDGMREYYRRYRDRNASSDDLRQVMEQVSGKDLKAFFAQWLTRGGTPRIESTWRYDAARKVVELTMRQTQAGDPYVLAVDVELAAGAEKRIERAHLTGASTTVSLPIGSEPTAIVLDPHVALLADIAASKRVQ